MASLKHLQKQGEPAKWSDLLVNELYVIVTYHGLSILMRGKGSNLL